MVEGFDFEKSFDDKQEPIRVDSQGKKIMHEESDEFQGLVSYTNKIFEKEHKAFNFATAYYSKFDKMVNPKLMLRFDCRAINDIQVLRLPIREEKQSSLMMEQASQRQLLDTVFDENEERSTREGMTTPGESMTPGADESSKRRSEGFSKKTLFLVAACSDHYIRFFNLQSIKVIHAIKSQTHNGMPLCFDISPDKQLIAVGYEDDSFITYYFELHEHGYKMEVTPIMRGVGHKNFVSSIKFDRYFQINHLKYVQQQFDQEMAESSSTSQLPAIDAGSQRPSEQLPQSSLGNYKEQKMIEEKKEIKSLSSQIKQTVEKGRALNS